MKFNIVVGNPPYLQVKKVKHSDSFNNFELYSRSSDLYCIFFELSLNLLKSNGHLSLLTPNKWMRSAYGEPLRNYLNSYSKGILIEFNSNIFDEVMVDSMISLIKNEKNEPKKWLGFKLDGKDLDSRNFININLKENEIWEIYDFGFNSIKNKIEKNERLIDLGVELYYGILTGANKVFILDEEKKEYLLGLDKNIKKYIKPLLRGKDIEKYKAHFKNFYLLNLHNGIPNVSDPVHLSSEGELYKYLESFGEKFKKRGERGKNWYNLRSCNYLDVYGKNKIIYSDIVQEDGKFYLDTKGYYTNDTAFLIYHPNINILKYLTGVLNSKVVSKIYLMFYSGGRLGNKGLRYKKKFISQLPIPKYNENLVVLVDEIIKLKEQGSNTQKLENQIDDLICNLYGLSEEERLLIKND